jgi:hypothetical protein
MYKAKHVVLFLCVLGISTVVFALGTENFGDKPIEISCDWYDGVAVVAQSPGMIYSRWVNGGEDFYYKADTNTFNNVLQKFDAVSSPLRRLIIESGSGTAKSLQGDKEFTFDWKLDIASGIYLHMLISDNTMKKDQMYPSITLFLGSGSINIEQLNIPAGIDVIIADSARKDSVLFTKVQKLACWTDALDKWRQFVQPYLEKTRKDLNDPAINCVEMRSQRISRYLPKHRIFVIETTGFSDSNLCSNLFAVSVTGEITDLSKPMFALSRDNKRLDYPSLSSFLMHQQIRITDADTAISVVKLTQELFSAPKTVVRIKLDTHNFAVFDDRLYPSGCKEDYWQYTAEKQTTEWIVKKKFIGPPTCRDYSVLYGVSVDQNDIVQRVWSNH